MSEVYIFDFDGTLVDSMDHWAGVHIEALKAGGIEVPENFTETITPLGNLGAAKYTLSLGLKEEFEEYFSRVTERLCRVYGSTVPLKEGAKEALLRFKAEARGSVC